MKKKNTKWILVFSLGLVSCSKSAPSAPAVAPALPALAERPTTAQTAPASGRGVKTEMRNVLFHLTAHASAHLEVLSGELWPTGKNEMVVFDDKNSFEVRVTNGTVSISPEGLSDIMNNHVFARKDASLKDITVSIDKGRLIVKGKLHSKGDIPFATAVTLNVSSDGRLRVHTEKITALRLPLKGVMGLFGIELANVVNTSKIDGMDTDKNDLLMDLGKLLPAPHIRGKLSGVHVENNAIVTTFGDGGKSLSPPTEKGNYMTFQGSPVRFGKLVMEQADLTVLDLDPGDPLDWDQDYYKEQLIAGYSKINSNFGVRAYVRDYSKLGRSSKQALKVPLD